jgi:hypothetical protein
MGDERRKVNDQLPVWPTEGRQDWANPVATTDSQQSGFGRCEEFSVFTRSQGFEDALIL